MDVQMPVIDGYKCTHLLRYHTQYRDFAKDVPIVAMTASAIQGDREKCEKAGMDDYLSKPVRGKALEKMLIHWSQTQRRELSPYNSESSDCSDSGSTAAMPTSPTLPTTARTSRHSNSQQCRGRRGQVVNSNSQQCRGRRGQVVNSNSQQYSRRRRHQSSPCCGC